MNTNCPRPSSSTVATVAIVPTTRTRSAGAVFALAVGLAVVGVPAVAIAAPTATSAAASPKSAQSSPQTLTVFAAASLKEVFQRLGALFESEHPGTSVRFSFAGTQELRVQLEHGAEADVFAAADTKHTAALHAAGRIAAPTRFAQNRLVLIVPPSNPAAIATFADLPRAQRLVLGTDAVPIGAYGLAVIDKAAAVLGPKFRSDVMAHVVSRELNVKQIVAKVILGEADAALVYETDARAAGEKTRAFTIPAAWNVTADYPGALVSGSPRASLGAAFVRLLLGPAGQKELQAAGFVTPPSPR